MKKVLIFSLAYYPHVGGAEVAIKELTDRIKDVEFHIVTLLFSRQDAWHERLGNIQIHRVGFGGAYVSKILFVPLAALAARTLHRREMFDAAWVMMSYMLLPLTLARLNVPYVLTLQEGDTYGHMFRRLRVLPFLPLLNAGFRHATVVQVISNYLGGWVRKRGCTGPIEVIPNGVDIQKFSGKKVSHVGVVLIHTGRLVHKNALDIVVRTLAFVPPDISLRLVGDGPEQVSLKLLAENLGVAGRVEFLPYVEHNKLSTLLHAADIFIRPSRSEGMGNSFVEAMAAGLPVIATQEGGIADFLFDAKRNPDKPSTGWAVDKDNPEQIAAAVKDILSNPEQVSLVIKNAQELVIAKYDWDLIARQMREKVFARVL